MKSFKAIVSLVALVVVSNVCTSQQQYQYQQPIWTVQQKQQREYEKGLAQQQQQPIWTVQQKQQREYEKGLAQQQQLTSTENLPQPFVSSRPTGAPQNLALYSIITEKNPKSFYDDRGPKQEWFDLAVSIDKNDPDNSTQLTDKQTMTRVRTTAIALRNKFQQKGILGNFPNTDIDEMIKSAIDLFVLSKYRY